MVEVFHVEPDAVGYLSPALGLLQEVCAEADIEFFVVGAAARDLLLEHVYGVRPFRSTGDVDIAVAVGGWAEYDALVEVLVSEHGFGLTEVEHRVRRSGLVVDVVPFGEIASDSQEVEWPETNRTMSVLGYPEAFEAAVGVQIGEAPPVRVASLAGVVVLKLVAWSEAPHRRRQDPVDTCAIMMNYGGVADEALYTGHDDLLNGLDDMRVAYAQILGRDVAALLAELTLRAVVLDLLRANTEDEYESRFVQEMGAECHPRLRVSAPVLPGVPPGCRGAAARRIIAVAGSVPAERRSGGTKGRRLWALSGIKPPKLGKRLGKGRARLVCNHAVSPPTVATPRGPIL